MTERPEKKSKKKLLFEYAEAILTALLLALIIRAFVIQAFKIPSGSMVPTLLVGDHILVNKFVYGVKLPGMEKKVFVISKPGRGDIVVFRYPENPDRDFIKRIVAREGDMIESKDKTIYINQEPVEESYIRHTDDSIKPSQSEPRDNFGPIVVPKGKYFVMGDNRDQSYDSRFWGFVDENKIKGKALIIYWSWDKQKKFPRFQRLGRLVK